MESNEEIKGTIALAKAVRQTALANAKVALEEAFTEKYQAMFAQKLKEDAAEGVAPAAAAPMQAEETVSEQEIDELIKELESEVGGEGDDADDVAAGAPADAAAPAPAPADPLAGAGAAPAAPAAGAQMVMCPVGTVATADMAPAPVGGAVPPMGAPALPGVAPVPPLGGEAVPPVAPAPVGGEVPPAAGAPAPAAPPSDIPSPEGDGSDEEVNLDELLESLKAEVEGEKEEDETIDEQTKLASSGIAGSDNKKPSSGASSSSKVESGGDKDGYAKVDQAKVVAKEATQAGRPNQASHATKDNLSTPGMGSGKGSGGQSETGHPKTDQAKTTAKEATQASRPNQAKNATATNLSTPGGMLQENAALKKQLAEAIETITYVKGQLNEINLLNAKLLYTNKLFKEYNMNNEQKMRIVEMFDLSKNVREVKLTFANIAESLNFSGTDIKRKVKTSAVAQSITEGLASQSVGSTKPSQQIISEGKANQMVTRFQQIAGIKPTKK